MTVASPSLSPHTVVSGASPTSPDIVSESFTPKHTAIKNVVLVTAITVEICLQIVSISILSF